jgi:hypothetical protein
MEQFLEAPANAPFMHLSHFLIVNNEDMASLSGNASINMSLFVLARNIRGHYITSRHGYFIIKCDRRVLGSVQYFYEQAGA